MIHVISLGPGDPELITVKALRILRKADVIFCPETGSSTGITCPSKFQSQEDTSLGSPQIKSSKSRAYLLLRELGITPEHIQPFYLPMRTDRKAAREVYDRLFQQLEAHARTGASAVVVAEGDAGIYSSGNYVYERLQTAGHEVVMVPGIPAFLAAGATAGLHLIQQHERLVVIPGTAPAAELQSLTKTGYTVVVMKLSRCANEIQRLLQIAPSLHFHYFENVGTPAQYYTDDPEIIAKRPFPYFSLLILKA